MGRVSTCQKNCNTIDLRGAQVNYRSLAGGATSTSAIAVNLRWISHMILTEARYSFPDIPNMEWYNKT